MNFRGACLKQKYIYIFILERVDGVNGEISMNLNDQCRVKAQLDRTAYRSRRGTDN